MKLLLVVDMLNDFLDPQGALYCGDKAREIVPFVAGRVEEYRNSQEGRIIFLNDNHLNNDKEFQRFPKHAVSGTWGSRVIPELQPTTDTISKTRFSGFFQTELEYILYEELHDIESVEVVGVCTSICVMDTVGGLSNRDFENIIVPRAGVADFDPEMHEFALKRMERIYGAKVI